METNRRNTVDLVRKLGLLHGDHRQSHMYHSAAKGEEECARAGLDI